MSERLTTIISQMLHTGTNARRNLTRGLIISYIAPEPDVPREQQRYQLTAARVEVWPDDRELKIVHDCLYRAWRHHPTALIYDISDWTKRQLPIQQVENAVMGAFTIYWRQWPVREVFNVPAGLQDTLRAALAHR